MSRAPAMLRKLVPAPILLILAACLAAPSAIAQVPEPVFEELVLQVSINEQAGDEALMVLRDAEGGFWIHSGDLARLRLRPPAAAARVFDGRSYLPLGGYIDAQIRFDSFASMLHVRLTPEAFDPVALSRLEPVAAAQTAAATGMFLNYRLHGQRLSGSIAGGTFTELGMFSRFGVLTSTTASRHGRTSTVQRLDTVLRHDFTGSLRTLKVGDAIMDPGSFGAALRLAGVQLEKNFSIRPELVTTPLLRAAGAAVVPSAVDVFVNDRRVLSGQVKPGPFVIDNLPAVTGAGDLRVVVRDATGQEQVLVQEFYSSPQLLARGLSQYSFSLGSVREDYGFENFGYGAVAGGATLRRGVSDYLTLEGHAEFLGSAWGLGSQLAARLGNAGIANLTLAGGGHGTRGLLAGGGFERQGMQGSAGVQVSWASPTFRRIGEQDEPAMRQKLRAALQLGWQFGRFGGTTLAVVRQTTQDGAATSMLSLLHGLRAGQDGYVNLSVNHSMAGASSTSAYLSFTRAFGERRSLAVGAEGGNGANGARRQLRASVTQTAPAGEGNGWRVSAARDGSHDLLWQQRLRAAELDVQTTRNFGRSGQSMQLRGGVSWLGGRWRAMRAVGGSFAVVDVGGIADVPVYLENRLIARTDSSGRAVLPELLSYQANRISIDPEDLPLDAAIGAKSLLVRPAYRSGVVIDFPVERISPAVFRLRLSSGVPVPTGAEVRLNGGTFVVALDGYTYVTTLDQGVSGWAQWPGGSCSFRVLPPPPDDPLPDMGDINCQQLQEAAR